MYRLRFVLDGMRNLFHLVVLECIFMFKSSSLVNPKDMQCFSGIDMGQKGTGRAEIYIL